MESEKLNLALDDIIKKNKTNGRSNKDFLRRKSNNKQKNFSELKKRKFNDFEDFPDKKNFNHDNRGFSNNLRRNNKFSRKIYEETFKSFNKVFKRRNRDDFSFENNFRIKRKRNNISFDANKGNKILISNLHYNISNGDLNNLFSEFANIKRCGIYWDRVGVSKGEAYVEYYNAKDAEKAINEMNGKLIEGMNIKVELKDYN